MSDVVAGGRLASSPRDRLDGRLWGRSHKRPSRKGAASINAHCAAAAPASSGPVGRTAPSRDRTRKNRAPARPGRDCGGVCPGCTVPGMASAPLRMSFGRGSAVQHRYQRIEPETVQNRRLPRCANAPAPPSTLPARSRNRPRSMPRRIAAATACSTPGSISDIDGPRRNRGAVRHQRALGCG
jgi:hypothetical protein